jgi:hypothetical protein
VTNADDDVAGITVGAASGTSTSEARTSVTFTLALRSQPSADVSIPLSSSRADEATVSPSLVVFTAALRDIDRALRMPGRDHAGDPFPRGKVRRHIGPLPAAVDRRVQPPVVGSGIEQSSLLRRLAERHVGPRVQQDLCSMRIRQGEYAAQEFAKIARGQILLPDLNPLHAVLKGAPDEPEQGLRSAGGAAVRNVIAQHQRGS